MRPTPPQPTNARRISVYEAGSAMPRPEAPSGAGRFLPREEAGNVIAVSFIRLSDPNRPVEAPTVAHFTRSQSAPTLPVREGRIDE